jgi:class 3 adenylate cyclase/tetratricopeptide (TPR) repeat protein
MPVEGERRVVTMLFCDVVGSTAMAETLDPEDWTEIMNGAFERMSAPIERYEGTIARLMGDAIFAFFGAPTAHEDDPERAVAAGLAIVEAVAPYRDELKDRSGLELNVRVGINTGPVVVGQVGSGSAVEYTAMGDAVNVAARMEQTADPGTVRITEETRRLVAGRFEVDPRGAIEVKGKAEPVTAYRVVGRTGLVGRELLGGPLVGRDHEMEQLRRAVDDALDGRGQLISLIGDAGLGKTRLIEEVRTHWTTRERSGPREGGDIRRLWETWRCVSYDTTRPYAQYRRMVATMAEIADTDPPGVVRRKLAAIVEPEATTWLQPHLRVWRSLFGVTEPDEAPLEGQAFRDAITELVPAATRFFGAEPRLLVFEDLHWCDEASMDLLIETAKVVEEQPSLFLFAYRPDRRAPSWRLKQWIETEFPHRSSEIVLRPLDGRATAELIDTLLPDSTEEVRSELVERTEGNPLFVHELAAAAGGDARSIPATLQALITARLDTLDDETRRTLQLASVIGRSFTEPVLGEVAGDGAELLGRLRTLERVGLVQETARTPEREFAFHHSLTQDATYATILKRGRRELHARVGETLERRYADRAEEFAALLARHFEEAEDDERTLRYATMAGDQAARLYANAEAITHYTAAIEAATRLDRSEEPLRHLYPSRGRTLELAGRFDEAVETYEAMRALAVGRGDRVAALNAATSLATLFSIGTPMFDATKARAANEETISIARELGERLSEAKALWNLMNLDVFGGGDLREAAEAGERSLAIAREIGDRVQRAFSLNDLWRPYTALGDLERARASLEEAQAIWRELENLPMLSENLTSLAALARFDGDDDRSLTLSDEAFAVASGIDNLWGQSYALMHAFEVRYDRGEIGPAMEMMRTSIELGERVGFVPPLVTSRSALAIAYAYLGDLTTARGLARLALEIGVERQPIAKPVAMWTTAWLRFEAGELEAAEAMLVETEPELLPEPRRSNIVVQVPLLSARIALARGEPASAMAIADEILALEARVGNRQLAAEVLLVKGRALAASGDTDGAAVVLGTAKTESERLQRRLVLWEVLAELADVTSDPAEAAALRAEAHELVVSIAGSVEDDDLRKSFLARTDLPPA